MINTRPLTGASNIARPSTKRNTVPEASQSEPGIWGYKPFDRLDSAIFNWSKTMPADPATPPDVDYNDAKTNALFNINLATNAATIAGTFGALMAIPFGLPGFVIGSCGLLACSALGVGEAL